MNSESFYCLTTSDANSDAYSIFKRRIKEKKWPMYWQTKFQSVIKPGDKLIFYIAGVNKFRQCFVGSAEVNSIDKISNTAESTVDPDKTQAQVTSYIHLNNIKLFNKKVFIKNILNNLNFIENKKNYGLYFIGGVTKIDQASNSFILNQSVLR